MILYNIYLRNLLAFFFFLVGCNCDSKRTIKEKENPKSHKFVKDIPVTPTGKPFYPYQFINEYTKKTGIAPVENGFDSMIIRFWFLPNIGSWQVLEIKKDDEKWTGENNLLAQEFSLKDSSFSLKKLTISKTPKSGWDDFISKLFSKGLTSMPTDFLIPDYEAGTDGDILIVETATVNSYRIFSYGSLFFNLNSGYAKKMSDIVLFIEKEFEIKVVDKQL